MPSISALPRRAARRIDDGDIRLSNGQMTLLSTISGTKWTRQRIQRLTDALQVKMDNRFLISSMQVDDPDKAPALAGDDAHFQAIYGGRRFIDGNSLVDRSTLISIELRPRDRFIDAAGGTANNRPGVLEPDLVVTVEKVS